MSRLLNPIGVASAAMRTPARRRVVSVVLCSMLLSHRTGKTDYHRVHEVPCAAAPPTGTQQSAGSGLLQDVMLPAVLILYPSGAAFICEMLPCNIPIECCRSPGITPANTASSRTNPLFVVYPEQSKSRVF